MFASPLKGFNFILKSRNKTPVSAAQTVLFSALKIKGRGFFPLQRRENLSRPAEELQQQQQREKEAPRCIKRIVGVVFT